MAAVQTQSIITCPSCHHAQAETMPTDACQVFYRCAGCGVFLRPKGQDCCVFCSYGDTLCPPRQQGEVAGPTQQRMGTCRPDV